MNLSENIHGKGIYSFLTFEVNLSQDANSDRQFWAQQTKKLGFLTANPLNKNLSFADTKNIFNIVQTNANL